MAGADNPLLTVRRAAKFFGNKLVFKEISCEVRSGEILLVAGPNGAGKSTLLSPRRRLIWATPPSFIPG